MSGLKKRRALYPGSFDPVTYGHMDIINRARELFDEVYVAIATNDEKNPLFPVEDRVQLLKQTVKGKKGITVSTFDGLIVDYARANKIGILIRGLRATSDFDYEFQMALTNRELASHIDTIFLMPSEKHFYLSSRLVKEISRLGGDVSKFVPPFVARALKTYRALHV
ncbi:MAG TPA: pantetheine-phosphate adenylyltransferase [Candidatus Omnitrophota bacterium]|nr:pantetheine-phosphate adenylyltransferase [Candidatus Omnitrophota bacterium]